ncbi:E3 ubiquitin-protein ligase ZNRF4-like [Python bivittatus]|uniref:E3 ubiquitin-protein ligase ZNRF4-like n=1 Tax=Python bivittatus TaxID=176946 RepID=A0A9F5ING0_PYTBI|nr:E3 ubiquitin-protein ligase ZNRF4-like [Python bivittatus]
MVILLHLTTNEALIRAVYNHNGISQDFEALHSDFGPLLRTEGLLGYLIEARPANACQPIKAPPLSKSFPVAYIALIQRYDCPFTTKVLHAQQAGYHAAIVHNVNSQALVIMMGEKEMRHQVNIPSMFISESASTQLKRIFHYDQTAYVILIPDCHWLSCWNHRSNCQSSPHQGKQRHLKQMFPFLSNQCHISGSTHYLLLGLMLAIWIVAFYIICFL